MKRAEGDTAEWNHDRMRDRSEPFGTTFGRSDDALVTELDGERRRPTAALPSRAPTVKPIPVHGFDMGDTKEGRDKQGRDEERRQRERDMREQRERGDEEEPAVEEGDESAESDENEERAAESDGE